MRPTELHAYLIDATATARLLSDEITHNRHVDPRDRDKPDLGGVAALLARELARLRDAVEAAQERRGAAT